MEAGGRVGRARVELVREADRGRAALVDRAVVGQVGGRGDVVDVDAGGVFAEAAVLVDDPRLDGVVRGTVVVGAGRGVAGAGAGVGAAGEVAVGAAVGVVEAGGRVGRARVELVREADRGRAAFVDRAVVGQVGGRGDVVDVDAGGVFAEAAVLVDDPRLDGVVAGSSSKVQVVESLVPELA